MAEFLKDKLYLYQIGDGRANYFILPKSEYQSAPVVPFKEQVEDNNFIDGQTRTNLGERNFLGGASVPTNFNVSQFDYFSLGYVKKVANLPPQKAFLFTLNASGDLKMFFNPVFETVARKGPVDSSNQDQGQATENIRLDFKSVYPFVFECKSNIAYFDYDNYEVTKFLYEIGTSNTYNGTKAYGEADVLSTISLGNLTLDQKLELFRNCNPSNALVYNDKFFELNSFGIESGQEVINQTLTNNLILDIDSTDILKDTTADNRIYIIEITGSLTNGEWVQIQNLSNLSSLQFTWKGASPSPSVIYYNSFYNAFYNAAGVQIDPLDYDLDQPAQPNFLFFTGLASQNQTLTLNTESIRLQKSSVANLTIKLENLNTYYL